MKSAYGRENLHGFIRREREAGHIVYEDKTKARHLLRVTEKQYLKALANPDYEITIADKNGKVNTFLEENQQGKQELGQGSGKPPIWISATA